VLFCTLFLGNGGEKLLFTHSLLLFTSVINGSKLVFINICLSCASLLVIFIVGNTDDIFVVVVVVVVVVVLPLKLLKAFGCSCVVTDCCCCS
jgi:hypothetical protein